MDEIAIADLIALDLVAVAQRLAGLGVDIDAFDGVAGLAVEHPERDLFGMGDDVGQFNGAGDQRKLQIALPGWTRRHDNLPERCGSTENGQSPFRFRPYA
jgi:hypothetical protein